MFTAKDKQVSTFLSSNVVLFHLIVFFCSRMDTTHVIVVAHTIYYNLQEYLTKMFTIVKEQ